MSDTLLLTEEREEEWSEGVGGWGGGSFLIEFPDNTEINLTPVKFDYSAAAPPILRSVFLSFFFPFLLFLSASSKQTLLIQITLS